MSNIVSDGTGNYDLTHVVAITNSGGNAVLQFSGGLALTTTIAYATAVASWTGILANEPAGTSG